ncbi:LuxR C-terminal-related transcriptional regulator [Chromobacterium piscinae]|uniref:LuxR C-terminal-related transcriptional regulator n=1 Tax=Chromobacterium piscinae TaxID=686831 RepID=UPI003F810D40
MSLKTRIIIAVRQKLVSEGLTSLLAQQTDFEVVDQVTSGTLAVESMKTINTNIILIDTNIPGLNYIDVTSRILKTHPHIKILCLAEHGRPQTIHAALENGAHGFLLTDCSSDELIRAIKFITNGQLYLSPSVTADAMNSYRNKISSETAFTLLTSREREIVQMLAEGHSTKRVASRLGISFKTVATHRQHALAKLGVHGIADLTRYAIREGLVTP